MRERDLPHGYYVPEHVPTVEQAVAAFAERHINRWDRYAIVERDGTERRVLHNLEPQTLLDHLEGKVRLATPPVDAMGHSRWICLTALTKDARVYLERAVDLLASDYFVPGEMHRDAQRTYSAWVYFSRPIPLRTAWEFSRLVSQHMWDVQSSPAIATDVHYVPLPYHGVIGPRRPSRSRLVPDPPAEVLRARALANLTARPAVPISRVHELLARGPANGEHDPGPLQTDLPRRLRGIVVRRQAARKAAIAQRIALKWIGDLRPAKPK